MDIDCNIGLRLVLKMKIPVCWNETRSDPAIIPLLTLIRVVEMIDSFTNREHITLPSLAFTTSFRTEERVYLYIHVHLPNKSVQIMCF